MLIKSLQLCNFRQYRQLQNIQFAYDGEKNVTVILGRNSSGKTTIVQSFIWCLYGRETFDEGDELLNIETESKLLASKIGDTASVSAQVVLVHNGNEYIINRIRTYKKIADDKLSHTEKVLMNVKDKFGGQDEIEKEKIENLINEILPEDLSDFFFYRGEKIEEMNKKKNISDSVKKFMGLDILDKTRTILKRTSKEFLDDMTDTDKSNKTIIACTLKNKDIDDKINTLKIKRSEAYDNYENYHNLWEKDNDALIKNNVNAVSDASKEIEVLEKKIEILKLRLDQNKNDYINSFCQNISAFYAQGLAKKARKILDDNNDDIMTYSNITAKTIKEILDSKKCICGRPFCDGDDVYKELTRVCALVPPNRIDNEVRGYKSYIAGLKGSADSYLSNLVSKRRMIQDTEEVIEDTQKKIDKLKKVIDDFPDAAELKNKADFHYKQQMEFYSQYTKLNSEIEQLNEERTKNEKIIKKNRDSLDENNYQQKLSDYAMAAWEKVDASYRENESVIKAELQKYISLYFDEMYAGKRDAILNDDYSITLYGDLNGVRTRFGAAPGIRTVRNFAFVASMVKMAKEKATDIDDTLTCEPYPLVLDAPFSATDENHVPAISRLVSKVAEQTIIVVMAKDWEYAKDIMSDKVGLSYIIDPISEHESRVVAK